MTVRRWLDQIGGPSALSIWSWLITLPVVLVVGNVSAAQSVQRFDVLRWSAIILAIHALVGAVMWLSAVTLLPNRPRRARPAVALAVFAVLGLARVGLLEWLDPMYGPQGATLESRMLTNVVGGTLILALIAVLVDDYRTHAAIERQLRQAQTSLSLLAEQESEALRAADIDEIARVRTQVEEQLRSGAAGPEHIRNISESIVRAQSHHLAEESGSDPVLPQSSPRPRREIATSVLNDLRWPNPLALAVIVELLVIGSVASVWSWSVAVANALFAGTFIAAAATALRHFIPLPPGRWARPAVIILTMVALAVVTSLVSSTVVTAIAQPFAPAFGLAVILFVVIGLGVSTWSSVTRDRREQRESLLAAVSQEARAVERIHGEVASRRAAAAEFLHGPIQSQLVASALKGESNEEALAAIEKRFAEYAGATPDWDAHEQVNELVSAWADVFTIDVTCSDETWERIHREPLVSRLLVDTLSEAVTNVVRHGEVADIDVTIDVADTDARVRLTVSSVGTLSSGIGDGTGLARLTDRGALISLEQENERVVMQALL